MGDVTTDAWPRAFDGIIESVIATEEPDGQWNLAALGLHAPEDHQPSDPLSARTWGNTRTRGNLDRGSAAHVQLVDDPVDFVSAALDRWEREEPVLPSAAASTTITAQRRESGTERGVSWVDWELRPQRSRIYRQVVPALSRGSVAVVEMTIAASRLGVPGYDADVLFDRLDEYARIALRCGGSRERRAVRRVADVSDWSLDRLDHDGDAR